MDERGFRSRLKALIKRAVGEYKPGTFGKIASKWRPKIGWKIVSDCADGNRMPGLDIARALARAGNVSIDCLAGDFAVCAERYKEALRIVLMDVAADGPLQGEEFTSDDVLERYVRKLLKLKYKKGEKEFFNILARHGRLPD